MARQSKQAEFQEASLKSDSEPAGDGGREAERQRGREA